MMIRRCALVLGMVSVLWAGCGDDAGTPSDAQPDAAPDSTADMPPTASVSGDVFPFNVGSDARLEGATVTFLEHPEMSVTTGADGHFSFDGLEVGSRVTLRMTHPDYHRLQTGTLTVPSGGLQRVTFQAVSSVLFAALADVVGAEPDEENACQVATTVTRVGRSMYDPGAHGEAEAIVTMEPALPAEHGPIYFNEDVVPDPELSETTEDGGVVYVNVPPGEYVLRAEKEGVTFAPVTIVCEPGWLVNASPPWGLQAQ